jgi:hypothetical protein
MIKSKILSNIPHLTQEAWQEPSPSPDNIAPRQVKHFHLDILNLAKHYEEEKHK